MREVDCEVLRGERVPVIGKETYDLGDGADGDRLAWASVAGCVLAPALRDERVRPGVLTLEALGTERMWIGPCSTVVVGAVQIQQYPGACGKPVTGKIELP